MTKTLKIATIMMLIIFTALIGLSVGVTAAYWGGGGSGSSEEGEGTVYPQINANWNAWVKYFTYSVDASENNVYITGYKYTTMSTLVFPKEVTLKRTGSSGSYSYSYTTETPNDKDIKRYVFNADIKLIVANTFLKDTTLKNQITKIYFSSAVTRVEEATFAGMLNLQEIYFESSSTPNLYDYAFAGCVNLTHVYGRSASAYTTSTVFKGCPNVTFG